jgi:hypothetical protein
MTLTRPRLALVGVLSLVALTGCSGGGVSGSATAGGASGSHNLSEPAARAAAGTAQDVASMPLDASSVVEQRAVIKNGDIAIHTTDPQRARDRVGALLIRLQGTIDDEQTVYDKSGQIRDSQLVLRVPVASFASAMDDLEHLGTVVHSRSSGKDVTTEVIDVQQRLRTLRISLHDLNSFQRQASNINELLRFESAITQRRGEYQSLKAQRNHLVNETSMSTISLDISVPPAHAAPAGPVDHAGFVTGLKHGWSALTGTVVVALTAVGAVLPFAVVLALLGLPLWWWMRRASRIRPATPAESPPAD